MSIIDQATNKKCAFYNELYANNCSALSCKHTFCQGCHFFIPKTDQRHKDLMREYHKWYKGTDYYAKKLNKEAQ